MSGLLKYLNSPELVFKVQSFFGVKSSQEKDQKFRVTNRFFYYLFLLGTELGDEIFYGIAVPLFFFNVDSFVGRRFVFHWFINMYVGQALKEVFLEERPKAPAIPMQNKWSNEYSLPSTHAMGSLSIAASVVYFSLERWNLNLALGISFVILWTTLVSLSRVYLGMHSVLDLVSGIAISSVLLVIFLPLTNLIEHFFATNVISPVMTLIAPVVLIVYFPTTEVWTPTRADTCVIAGVFSGIELGIWINYQFGIMNFSDVAPSIELDSLYKFIVRAVVGLTIAGLTEVLGKFCSSAFLSMLVGVDRKAQKASEHVSGSSDKGSFSRRATEDTISNTKKTFVDLTSKFSTYCLLGINILVLVPTIYKALNIQRDAFFIEL